MKLLYVEDDQDIRDLFALQIQGKYGFEIETADNAIQAIEKNQNTEFDIILSDYMMKGGSGADLYKWIKENKSETPFIFITGKEIDDDEFFQNFQSDKKTNLIVAKPINTIRLYAAIDKALESSPEPVKKLEPKDFEEAEGYTAVNINNFLRISSIPCDAYIKLSTTKYVKIIAADTMYTHSHVQNYMAKNIEKLYIHTKDFPALSEVFTSTLLKMYELNNELNDSQVQEIVRLSHHTLKDQLKNIGVTDTAMELAEKTIESSLNLFGKMDELSKLIDTMRKRNDYVYEHSMITSYVACLIAKNSSWNSDGTTIKLCMAALLHDITLEDPKLAKITSENSDEFKALDKKEQKLVLEHTQEAAELVAKFKQLPPDIDVIISQHHENAEAQGFPKKLSALRVAPLSALFIIAHDFASELFHNGFDLENRDSILERFSEKYSKGNFKTPLKGLIDSFLS